MELSKINLSALNAVGHTDEYLGLLIDKGENLEYVEVPAPIEAYEGLQYVAAIANDNQDFVDNYVEEQYSDTENQVSYYYEKTLQVEYKNRNGFLYKYQVQESLTVVKDQQDSYLSNINYNADFQSLEIEFDDGSVYKYEDVTPEFWEDFQGYLR